MIDVTEPWLNMGGGALFQEYIKTGVGMTKARLDAGIVLLPVLNSLYDKVGSLPWEYNEQEQPMVLLDDVLDFIKGKL